MSLTVGGRGVGGRQGKRAPTWSELRNGLKVVSVQDTSLAVEDRGQANVGGRADDLLLKIDGIFHFGHISCHSKIWNLPEPRND